MLSSFSNPVVERSHAEIALMWSEFAALSMGQWRKEIINGWDTIDEAMTVNRSDTDSLALPSEEDAYVLVIKAFSSNNWARKDPHKLPGLKHSGTNLHVITVRTCHDYSPPCVYDNT